MRSVAAALVGLLLAGACGGGGNPAAPTPTITTPAPSGGWDTDVRRLVDGAGNPGPVTVRLDAVTVPPGSAATADPLMVGFRSQFCMDAVSNPMNSQYLARMEMRVLTSGDGVSFLPGGYGPYSVEGPNHFEVQNGSCVTIQRMPVDQGGTAGHQFVFFAPGATHLVFAVKYGPWTSTSFMPWNNNQACPSFEEIARGGSSPGCVLRTAYPLDYRWNLNPTLTQYDGRWVGSGTGMSSASSAATTDITFDVSFGVISTIRASFRIESPAGTSQTTPCTGAPTFGSIRIENNTFSLSGGNTFLTSIAGTFTSPDSASGTLEVTPQGGAPASCSKATLNWTARKQ